MLCVTSYEPGLIELKKITKTLNIENDQDVCNYTYI